MKPGSLITAWIRNVAPLFKALDPNHMLTTGGEAFRTEGPVVPLQSWLNTGGNVGARLHPLQRLPFLMYSQMALSTRGAFEAKVEVL